MAFVFALGGVAWLLASRSRPLLLRLNDEGGQRWRLAAAGITVLLLVLSIAVAWLQVSEDTAMERTHELPGWTIAAALIVGCGLCGAGLILWEGTRAFRLRLVGWALKMMALAIPSTLTLALPLATLVTPTLLVVPRSAHSQATAPSSHFSMKR